MATFEVLNANVPSPATCRISGCYSPANRLKRTLCEAHYYRIRRYGDPSINKRPELAMTEEERFWRFVEKTETCWLWTGTKINGYGKFSLSLSNRSVPAHRWAYEHIVGPIPDGLKLDHLCRVQSCVNPAHLEPVTQRENIMRGNGFAAYYASRTHCKWGHEYTEANTRIYRGNRFCRECHRLRGHPERRH